jgi:tRNA1(Val) A37 N6-methylase TrmN6
MLLARAGLEPKRLRMIHPLPDAPARAGLVEAKPARPGGLRVESPFYAMRAPGEWSAEARRIMEGTLVVT